MENITFIIPITNIHEFKADEYMQRALKSIPANVNEIIVVGKEENINHFKPLYNEKVNTIIIDSTDENELINEAAFQCTSKYFVVLNYIDFCYPQYQSVYSKGITNHDDTLLLSLSVIREDLDITKNSFRTYAIGNALPWDASFLQPNEELGYISHATLAIDNNFPLYGTLIKTEDFITLGKLDVTKKFLAWYDFMTKVVENKKTIYVLPQITFAQTYIPSATTENTAMSNEEIETIMNGILDRLKIMEQNSQLDGNVTNA